LFSRLAVQSLLIFIFIVSPVLVRTASAQDQALVDTGKSDASVAGQITTATALSDLARQKREQAYVKLLEGQRLMVELRSNEYSPTVVVEKARQARLALEEAARLDPTLAEAYTALSEIALFYTPRNMDEAIRQANKAIAVNANNLGGHQMLGRIYALKSGLNNQQLDKTVAERAIIELREVSRLAPNDAETWAVLGELYLALGRTDEAIKALTRWAAAPPAVSNGFYQTITGKRELTPDAAAARLGEALMLAGRRQEAIQSIRRALYLDPENEAYEDLFSRIVDSAGVDDEGVIAELRDAIADEPQATTAPILLARILTRAGRFDEAIQTLNKAIGSRAASDIVCLL